MTLFEFSQILPFSVWEQLLVHFPLYCNPILCHPMFSLWMYKEGLGFIVMHGFDETHSVGNFPVTRLFPKSIFFVWMNALLSSWRRLYWKCQLYLSIQWKRPSEMPCTIQCSWCLHYFHCENTKQCLYNIAVRLERWHLIGSSESNEIIVTNSR